ncbi:LacI family DNA-binding transcriptional regulator [Microbacteriaceae bacterium VKM Ac-2855]|nr:LacI family DNA-binding transcriptional regulator [Microbacteriaceae bacterium VKM Ac-2855]
MPDSSVPRVTLADVAAVAGSSPSVVSRVLSGRGEVSTTTRERIQSVALELGYRRAGEARGRPRSRAGNLLELALGHFDDPWADEATAGALSAAAARGYDLVLTPEREDPTDDWPARVSARASRGVVVGLIRPTTSQLRSLAEAGVPVVLMDPRGDPPPGIPSVSSSNARGGYDAGAHLAGLGHRRFVALMAEPLFRFGRARLDGFRAAIDEHAPGGTIEVVRSEWSSGSARTAIAAHLTPGLPLAVFAESDALANGVIQAAADAGLRVPDDISVVGFDDLIEARFATPPLTTVRQPIRAIAAAAVVALVDVIEGRLPVDPDRVLPTRELPTRLMIRGSTAPPAAG